jgi:hypothetical protein
MYFLHPTLTCQARLNNFSKLFLAEQFSRKQKTCITQFLILGNEMSMNYQKIFVKFIAQFWRAK